MKKRFKKSAKSPNLKINWKVLAAAFIAVIAAGAIGSLFTNAATSDWYQSIKPAITPPNYVFPIVWTALYALIALSIYLSWTNAKGKSEKMLLLRGFTANLILNALWSILFFGMKNPMLALADLILLWVSIIFLIKTCWKINKLSAWLLLPYVLWVTFAGLLNYLIAFA